MKLERTVIVLVSVAAFVSAESTFREWNWSALADVAPLLEWGNPHGWNADIHYSRTTQISVSDAFIREPNSKSIRLFIDSQLPLPEKVDKGAHFRTEISMHPWHDHVPLGTEYWIGWSYYLPPTYAPDPTGRVTIFQGHVGRNGPPVEIYVEVPDQEIYLMTHYSVYVNQKSKRRAGTGIKFMPDHWYDFVVHTIWDIESGGRGLTELWVNGKKVSLSGGNVFDSDPGDPAVPYAGTPKIGMYKWPWRTTESVEASKKAGVTQLEMYVGPIRFLKNTGADVGMNGYDTVSPKGAKPK